MVVGCQPHAPAAFTPRDIPGTHFQEGLSRPQRHGLVGRKYVTEKSSDTTGNRSRDRPTSNAAQYLSKHHQILNEYRTFRASLSVSSFIYQRLCTTPSIPNHILVSASFNISVPSVCKCFNLQLFYYTSVRYYIKTSV
jgi:hypothetical protein